MMYKTTVVMSVLVYCECAYVYSSFWAPLVDPRILNYRVDARFDSGRDAYQHKYGTRGENLIADLGNGKGPGDQPSGKVNGDIQFYYTYPGANSNRVQ